MVMLLLNGNILLQESLLGDNFLFSSLLKKKKVGCMHGNFLQWNLLLFNVSITITIGQLLQMLKEAKPVQNFLDYQWFFLQIQS